MNEIEKLRKEREEALADAKAIAAKAKEEDRELTDEEVAEVEQLTAKAAELRDKITEAEEAERKRQAALVALAEEDDQVQEPIAKVRLNADKATIKSGEASEKFADFGDYLHAVRQAATESNSHGILERKLQAASGLNTVVDSEGGFLIAPQFSNEILRKMFEGGDILSRVRRIPLTGNTINIPYVNESSRADGSRWGGVRGYWREEAGDVTATKPDFGQLELKLKSAMCVGYVTGEQMQDYAATGSLLQQAFEEELTFIVENSIFAGNGAGKPLGVLSAPCVVQVTKETNQTADTLWGPNVVKMWSRCPSRNRKNAVWVVEQSVEPYMWGLTLEGRYGSASTAVEGVPLYIPVGTAMNQGQYPLLCGRPVIYSEHASAVGTAGDIMLADFSQYLLATKGGVKADSSIHVRFLYDEQTFRTSYRVDGAPWWSSALTPKSGGDTLSPFVKLQSRD